MLRIINIALIYHIFIINIFLFSTLLPQSNNIYKDGLNKVKSQTYDIETTSDPYLSKLSDDFHYFGQDGKKLFSKPLKWNLGEWLLFSGISVSTLILTTQDMAIKQIVENNKSQFLDHFVKIGDYYGSGYGMVIVPSTVYLIGLLSENDETRKTGRLLFESIMYSGATVMVMKIITGRARPYMNTDQYTFDMFSFKNSYQSFPSGHTVIAFAMSSVLASRIKNTWASIGLYSLASLTAFQRIYSNNHWISDTFSAAAIGTIIGITLVNLNEDNVSDNSNNFNHIPLLNFRIDL